MSLHFPNHDVLHMYVILCSISRTNNQAADRAGKPWSIAFSHPNRLYCSALTKKLAFLETQHYSCVVIPDFDINTGNLPPGVHSATWEKMTSRFGSTQHRRKLLEGLKTVLLALKAAGYRSVYIDGSFVTEKEHPNDFDGCWEAAGVDVGKLKNIAPELLDFRNRRKAQKDAYGGEMFLADRSADSFGTRFVEFFQHDKDTGEPKGIIVIHSEYSI